MEYPATIKLQLIDDGPGRIINLAPEDLKPPSPAIPSSSELRNYGADLVMPAAGQKPIPEHYEAAFSPTQTEVWSPNEMIAKQGYQAQVKEIIPVIPQGVPVVPKQGPSPLVVIGVIGAIIFAIKYVSK